MIKLCTKELLVAATWAEEHTELKHKSDLVHPRFTFRELTDNSGICTPIAITCETCDDVQVRPENSCHVTCFEDL